MLNDENFVEMMKKAQKEAEENLVFSQLRFTVAEEYFNQLIHRFGFNVDSALDALKNAKLLHDDEDILIFCYLISLSF